MTGAAPPVGPGLAGWRAFLDLLSDAVVVFDRGARIVFSNTAALRLLPCEAGMGAEQLEVALGAQAVRWLQRAAASDAEGGAAGLAGAGAAAVREALHADGRRLQLAWSRLDDGHGALRVLARSDPFDAFRLPAAAPGGGVGAGPAAPPAPPGRQPLSDAALRETVGIFWASPFPTTVQGADFRILDVNQAFIEFSGYRREQLVGSDPRALHPSSEWPAIDAQRRRLEATAGGAPDAGVGESRLVDASGRERRYRSVRRALVAADGQTYHLVVLQDGTAEQVAREQADRSLRELDDWFDFSPVGMVLFDDRGLLLRVNAAFQGLAEGLPQALPRTSPVRLGDAPEPLRALLLWDDPAALERLEPGAAPAHGQAWLGTPPGSMRALRSTVRCYLTAGGSRRYMAVVEDRSVEEERDLAQLQIGTLIDAAGAGIATFQESSGWLPPQRTPARQPPGTTGLPPDAPEPPRPAPPSAALQRISRDLVTAETLPEYERLQQALRHAQRAEVRYAIDHAVLGRRWLLTRVEPAMLASGARTTSVVTLDVTEQQQSQQRSEELLRELATILESSSAGIAYLRDDVIVRCNQRFEAMLGRAPGSATGCSLQALFGDEPVTRHVADEAGAALGEGATYETEFERPRGADTRDGPEARDHPGTQGAGARWYSLSIRRTEVAGDEAIAVLTDVTRLKAQQTELLLLARDRELMFSLSGVGIAFVREGRVQRANQALAQLVGRSVEALSGRPLRDLFANEADFRGRWAEAEPALRRLGRWSGEHQLRLADGGLLWVQVSKRLVTPGELEGGFIASYVNVDARFRAEQAVAQQADRTRSILDSVLVGIVTVGPRGIEWMNRSARRMFGGDLADFIGLSMATVATAEPAHPFRRTAYLTELVEGQAETFECRVQARDGREFWIVGNVVSIARESTGRQLTWALMDIERRREAEARMSEAQASLQRIIEAAPLAITLRDARTLRVLQTNGVAAATLGRSRESLIGSTPEDTDAPAAAAAYRGDMEAALAARDVTRREYRLDAAGDVRFWDARYLPLAAAPGAEPDQLLMVATDVTELRTAQEARLEAAIAQRDMLVKEVHHRIKNNLQGVAGLLQQIAEKKPEVAGAISEVVGQVQSIAQVYGLQVGSGGALHVVDVAQAITASVQRTFGRTIRCDVEGPDPRQWVLPEAESIPIALTLNELLTNAVKHSPASPEAVVRCLLVCGDDFVAVRIANAGRLPDGFDVARIPGGVSGLGLVRALLPRRSATLTLAQHGDEVVATVRLAPPGIARPAPGNG